MTKAVGQPAFVQDLQQQVEHIGVRLLDLVKQHHLVGLATDRFGQHPTLLITHVARRGTDQARNTVLFHIFTHVEAQQIGFVVKQKIGQCFGKLCFADPRWSQKQKTANWPVWVLQAGSGTTHGIGDGMHSLLLTNDPLTKNILQAHQPIPLPFEHFFDRNSRPASHHAGDIVLADFFLNGLCGRGGIKFNQTRLQVRDDAIA